MQILFTPSFDVVCPLSIGSAPKKLSKGLKLIDLSSSYVKEITEDLQKYGDVIKGLHDQAGDLSVQVCIENKR